MSFFNIGKLPPEYLDRLLKNIDIQDPRVVIGPRIGEDATVIDMNDRYLVVKTDPITFTAKNIGWYGIHVNANDVSVMGACPKWFLVTLLLPEGRTDQKMVQTIFDEIQRSCQELNITLCGGHTEITANLDRPILVGQMLGEVAKDQLIDNTKTGEGDSILLTQGIAIEGTAILANEMGDKLQDKINSKLISRAKRFIIDPGISVVKSALQAADAAKVHGMHDVTEGGLATGLWEMAQVCGCGLRIDEQAVSVFPETIAFCIQYNLDPWGLIASGALLIAVSPAEERNVTEALLKINIPCKKIAKVVPKTEGLNIIKGEKIIPLKPYNQDEITRIL